MCETKREREDESGMRYGTGASAFHWATGLGMDSRTGWVLWVQG